MRARPRSGVPTPRRQSHPEPNTVAHSGLRTTGHRKCHRLSGGPAGGVNQSRTECIAAADGVNDIHLWRHDSKSLALPSEPGLAPTIRHHSVPRFAAGEFQERALPIQGAQSLCYLPHVGLGQEHISAQRQLQPLSISIDHNRDSQVGQAFVELWSRTAAPKDNQLRWKQTAYRGHDGVQLGIA